MVKQGWTGLEEFFCQEDFSKTWLDPSVSPRNASDMFSRIPDANFCPKVVCMAVSAGSLRQADLLSGALLPGLDFRLTIPSPDTTHDGGGMEATSIRVKIMPHGGTSDTTGTISQSPAMSSKGGLT